VNARTRKRPGVGCPTVAETFTETLPTHDTALLDRDEELLAAVVMLFVDAVAASRPSMTQHELDDLAAMLTGRLMARRCA
jgi:hypothetical protein